RDASARGGGWRRSAARRPARARSDRPAPPPRKNPPINPVAITVRLQAGFPLGEGKSHYHAVTMEESGPDSRIIRLSDKVVPADRDFELTWTSAAVAAPSAGLFRQHVGEADYLLAFVAPPPPATPLAPPP